MEITTDPSGTEKYETLIDMHSVLNVLNVVMLSIDDLVSIVPNTVALRETSKELQIAAESLNDPDVAYPLVAGIAEHIDRWTARIKAARPDVLPDRVDEFESVVDNLRAVFDILRVRADEITARREEPRAWVSHDIDALESRFRNVFRAIERNGKGAYRIVSNVAEHERDDYLLNLEITSADERTVRMPAVFQDVMRDLIANARKYTEPGGMIHAGLSSCSGVLRFIVTDTGMGIPEDEISTIVSFGVRGSNAQGHATHGGGFGLTKAYLVTRTFGGRMWIESPTAMGIGTRVEIRIPEPV